MKLKILSIISFAILFIFVQSFSILATQKETIGAPGTEQPLFRQTDKNTGNSCYVYSQYVVMTVTSEDVGEDIKIYKRNNASAVSKECGAKRTAPAYMILKNSDANYFFGITGDKILVDSGTSAGERGLDIASLTSKKVIFTTSYQGSVKVVGDTVIYDKPSATKGSLKSCPNAAKWKKDGGSVGWVRSTKIDLTTLKETPAGQLACVYVE